MGYKIYFPTGVQLEGSVTDRLLVYAVTYEANRNTISMEDAIEIATSVVRQRHGEELPQIKTEYGARGTMTSVELYHDGYVPVTLPNSYAPKFAPAAVIRHDGNNDVLTRRFAFLNPLYTPVDWRSNVTSLRVR